MLQYSWLNNDFKSEIKAYHNLSITYFNIADLKNSKYYNEGYLTAAMEPLDSRIRYLACKELTWKQKERQNNRIIGFYYSQSVDWDGKPVQRVHRTNTVFDELDNSVAVNIEDYSAAWRIRQLTE